MSPRRKRSHVPDDTNTDGSGAAAQRRARNRLSQQQFRERKMLYIKQLEEQSKAVAQSESGRIKTLTQELEQLRAAALKAKSDLLKTTIAINSISEALDKVLHATGGEDPLTPVDAESDSSDGPVSTLQPAQDGTTPLNLDAGIPCPSVDTFQQDLSIDQDHLDQGALFQPLISAQFPTEGSVEVPLLRQPGQHFLHLPQGHLPVAFSQNCDRRSLGKQSLLSQHVEALELEARIQLDLMSPKNNRQMLSRCVSAIIHLCIRHAWPQASSVWFKSQVPDIIGPIIRWRLFPDMTTHQQLLPDYLPTPLQLSIPHSAIIDWVPYADLRDRVIMCFNGSAALDQLMCDMMNAYVIEVDDVSAILPNLSPERAYFGIWNLFSGIDSLTSISNPPATLPGDFPDCALTEVFSDPALVLKLAHDVCLHAAKQWRFDSSLFDAYPELKFDGYESIIAQGTSYRINCTPPGNPTALTCDVIDQYQKEMRATCI